MDCFTGVAMIKTALELLVAMTTAPVPIEKNEKTTATPRTQIVVIECCPCGQDECCASPTAAATPVARATSLVIESCPCGASESCRFYQSVKSCIVACFYPPANEDSTAKCDHPMITDDAPTSDNEEETSDDEDHTNQIVAALCDDRDDSDDAEEECTDALLIDFAADAVVEMAASISASVTEATQRTLGRLQQRAVECAAAWAVPALKCSAWFAILWIKEYLKLTLEMEIEKAREAAATAESKMAKSHRPCW